MESSRPFSTILAACFFILMVKYIRLTGEIDHCFITIDEYTTALTNARHDTEMVRARLQLDLNHKEEDMARAQELKQQAILDLETTKVRFMDSQTLIKQKGKIIKDKDVEIYNLEDTLLKFEQENDRFEADLTKMKQENNFLRKKFGVPKDFDVEKELKKEEDKKKQNILKEKIARESAKKVPEKKKSADYEEEYEEYQYDELDDEDDLEWQLFQGQNIRKLYQQIFYFINMCHVYAKFLNPIISPVLDPDVLFGFDFWKKLSTGFVPDPYLILTNRSWPKISLKSFAMALLL